MVDQGFRFNFSPSQMLQAGRYQSALRSYSEMLIAIFRANPQAIPSSVSSVLHGRWHGELAKGFPAFYDFFPFGGFLINRSLIKN